MQGDQCPEMQCHSNSINHELSHLQEAIVLRRTFCWGLFMFWLNFDAPFGTWLHYVSMNPEENAQKQDWGRCTFGGFALVRMWKAQDRAVSGECDGPSSTQDRAGWTDMGRKVDSDTFNWSSSHPGPHLHLLILPLILCWLPFLTMCFLFRDNYSQS